MKKRRKRGWRYERIIVGGLVLAFFIWAMLQVGLKEWMQSWFTPEAVASEVISPADSLQMRLDELRPIYVTIDDLNMRDLPSLKSSVLKKLPLHERVYYTGVVTDSTMRINIGKIIADEPWVQVIHQDGTKGWLYGAGVQFFKTENPNTLGN